MNTNVITGTIKELVARAITFNGNLLGQPELSVLTRLGIAREVSKISTGSKGKPATVWEFPCEGNFSFAANDAAPGVLEVIAEDTSTVSVNTETLEVIAETETQTDAETVPETIGAEVAADVEAIAAKPSSRSKRNKSAKAQEEVVASVAEQAAVTDEMDAPLAA